MQNDNEKFDLLVRSMMQDAEEAVSPRVWEGVSAGLVSRKRRRVLLWSAAGLAAAAALVLSVVLPGTHNSNLPNHIDVVSLAVPGPDDSCPDGNGDETTDFATGAGLLADNAGGRAGGPTGETAVIRSVSPAETVVSAPAEDAGASGLLASEAEDIPGSFASEDSPGSAAVQTEYDRPVTALRNEPETAGKEPEEAWEDPFARMEREDARQREAVRISVGFGGSMESNSNPDALNGIQMMRAPANQKRTHTVIEQTGATSAYAIPVSAGLNVRIGLGNRWAVGTGVNWTLLQRNFYGSFRENGKAPVYSEINNTLHYIGIPVNAYYSMLQGGRLGLYAFAGGSVEKALSNRFRTLDSNDLFYKESVDGVQFSVAAGFGLQFRLADHLGLYVDPSLRWYIPGSQPRSIRTQQPLMMNFEVGLRFDL